MALRCKPGDLVYCRSAGSFPEMIGRVFNVTTGYNFAGVWYWRTEPPQMGRPFGEPHLPILPVDFADKDLTPIRGGEGEDEMLRLAGKPNPTHPKEPVS